MFFYIDKKKYNNLAKIIFKWWSDIDRVLLFSFTVLIFFGVFFSLSTSPAIAMKLNIGSFHFAKKQLLFGVLAFSVMIFFSFLTEKSILIISFLGSIVNIILLIAVLFFAVKIKGAKRWLELGLSIQPSEILKPFFIIMHAYIIKNFQPSKFKNFHTFIKNDQVRRNFIYSVILIIVIDILLLLEPDTGMMVVYSFIWLLQIFITNIPFSFFSMIVGIILTIMTSISITLPHVRHRVYSFFKNDELSYQVKQAMQSISEGGFIGKGPGEGKIKFNLPDAHSDYIFAAIGEELGYLFCALLTILYFIIIIRIINHFLFVENKFLKYAGIGFSGLIFINVFIGIGVSINILPTKGTTLPLISYGGSSMLSMGILTGILLSLTRKKYTYEPFLDKIRLKNI